MSAFPVVETFHETEDLEFRLRAGRELNALQQLAFHRGEEALRHGVVETVARRPHRALDARCGALPGEHGFCGSLRVPGDGPAQTGGFPGPDEGGRRGRTVVNYAACTG